jgi:predicted nucleic acid-binding protein
LEEAKGRDLFVISELVLIELYRLLRNPHVFSEIYTAPNALEVIQSFREGPWGLVDYPGGLMMSFWKWVQAHDSPPSRLYDVRLALTLRHHGVTELATRNVRDFQGFGFRRVFDPVV